MDEASLSPVLEAIGLHHANGTRPVLVGLAGGVASGKSTASATLAALLTELHGHVVSVVSSDGFLHPNAELERRGLTLRKGFPESFDEAAITDFLDSLAAGRTALAPVHDHHTYDIGDEPIEIRPGDIVIIEGVNVLRFHEHLTLTIYLHADEPDMKRWFVDRATALRERARTEYSPFFDPWTRAPDESFAAMLDDAWVFVNLPNLVEAIEPTRSFADVVITKAGDHTITSVELRDRPRGSR